MDISAEHSLDRAHHRFKSLQHRRPTPLRECFRFTLLTNFWLLLQNAVLNYLADAYPTYAMSVLAGNNFICSMCGAGFPLFVRAMYVNLSVGWASTLLALLSHAFVSIPILLYKYGERIWMTCACDAISTVHQPTVICILRDNGPLQWIL